MFGALPGLPQLVVLPMSRLHYLDPSNQMSAKLWVSHRSLCVYALQAEAPEVEMTGSYLALIPLSEVCPYL
jgi:hypothetical protein